MKLAVWYEFKFHANFGTLHLSGGFYSKLEPLLQMGAGDEVNLKCIKCILYLHQLVSAVPRVNLASVSLQRNSHCSPEMWPFDQGGAPFCPERASITDRKRGSFGSDNDQRIQGEYGH